MMSNNKRAKEKALDEREKIVPAYERILRHEGVYYSHFFVNQLKDMVICIGPGLFQKNMDAADKY